MAERPAKRPRRTPRESTAATAAKRSPGKQRKKSGSSAPGRDSRAIYSFFNASTERQRTQTLPVAVEETEEDIILDDEDVGLSRPVNGHNTGSNKASQMSQPSQLSQSSAAARFASTASTVSPSSQPASAPIRPWVDQFPPTDLTELAVHKKKVADVRAWLDAIIYGKSPKRLLVLRGPAGTGKTTTMSLLARDLGCELLEWRNPTTGGGGGGGEGFAVQFEDFLGRGKTYGGLELVQGGSTDLQTPALSTTPTSPSSKLILVEEFPSTFSRASSACQTFRSTLLKHLAQQTAASNDIFARRTGGSVSGSGPAPVVLVISETLLATSSAAADSFTAHRLLGPDLLSHPAVSVIDFNPVARTLMAKALRLVLRKAKLPDVLADEVLSALGEVGDVRSAVSSLEFMYRRGTAIQGKQPAVNGKKKKTSKGDKANKPTDSASLETITQREASLGIFHAVGKVVYNKREPVSEETDESTTEQQQQQQQPHLAHFSRPLASQVNMESLMDETGTDISTFTSALHENYIPSCSADNGSVARSALEVLSDCATCLSDADILASPSSSRRFRRPETSSDALRQEEISFHSAVRGLLFHLPSPVKRTGVKIPGVRSDPHKMFYPTSLKLWRTQEEHESLLGVWTDKVMRGRGKEAETNSRNAKSVSREDGVVASWANAPATLPESNGSDVLITMPARADTLLVTLPYLAKIASTSAQRQRDSPSKRRAGKTSGLARLISFTGLNPDEEAEEEGEAEDESPGHAHGKGEDQHWATDVDREPETASPKARRRNLFVRPNQADEGEGEAGVQGVEKLVLSDDDIED